MVVMMITCQIDLPPPQGECDISATHSFRTPPNTPVNKCYGVSFRFSADSRSYRIISCMLFAGNHIWRMTEAAVPTKVHPRLTGFFLCPL